MQNTTFYQDDLFDGYQRKAEGMALVYSHESDAFKDAFAKVVANFVRHGQEFCADDIRSQVEAIYSLKPEKPRSIGPLMVRAIKEHNLTVTKHAPIRRATSHARPVAHFRSAQTCT